MAVVNGYAIKEIHAVTKVVYSDASAHSYGGYVVRRLGDEISHGTFTKKETGNSSTNRELAAVKYALGSLASVLRHQVVLWHSDNMNTAKITIDGSSKDHLQAIASITAF